MEHKYEKYCHNCGAVIDKMAEICPKCGVRQPINQVPPPVVSMNLNPHWLITVLLCGFLGVFGAHRFYNEHYGTAVLQLLTGGGLGIWYIIDFIMIITGNFKDKNGNYIKMN